MNIPVHMDTITVTRNSDVFDVACLVGPEGFKILFADPDMDIRIRDLVQTKYGVRVVCDVTRWKDYTFVETNATAK